MSSQDLESQKTLPSRTWSCGTMADGAEACRAISGVAFDKGNLQTALKVGTVGISLYSCGTDVWAHGYTDIHVVK